MPREIRKKLSFPVIAIVLALPGQAMAYTDLPGVRQPAIGDTNAPSACEQVLVRNSFPFEPTNGPRYSYVYSCRQGEVSIESNQLPPSLEREKRGLNY